MRDRVYRYGTRHTDEGPKATDEGPKSAGEGPPMRDRVDLDITQVYFIQTGPSMRDRNRFSSVPVNQYHNNDFPIGLTNSARRMVVFSPWSLYLRCLRLTGPRVYHF